MAENELRLLTRSLGSEPGAGERSAAPPVAHVEVAPRGERRLRLQLSGPLPDDWSLRLARALAQRSIGLRSGYARRLETGSWLADLEIDLRYRHGLRLDFLRLVTAPETGPPLAEPSLLDYELRGSDALGGSLDLEVEAWDAVGLLAAVLGRAAASGLHPAEVMLATEEDCAFHFLRLQRAGWRAPTARQHRGLARRVGGLLGAR